MTPKNAKLADAAWRNGRDCADRAVLHLAPPWTDAETEAVFQQMAEALIASYPGGPGAFAANLELIAQNVREGFNERLRELNFGMPLDGSHQPC